MARELTNKQKECAEYMVANPELTYGEVAKHFGITDMTLKRWRDRDDFSEYMHQCCVKKFKEIEKIAVKKLLENVEKNNQKAIEYLLDYTGFKSADKVEIQDKTIKIEISE